MSQRGGLRVSMNGRITGSFGGGNGDHPTLDNSGLYRRDGMGFLSRHGRPDFSILVALSLVRS